jgi:hypothetical protein
MLFAQMFAVIAHILQLQAIARHGVMTWALMALGVGIIPAIGMDICRRLNESTIAAAVTARRWFFYTLGFNLLAALMASEIWSYELRQSSFLHCLFACGCLLVVTFYSAFSWTNAYENKQSFL